MNNTPDRALMQEALEALELADSLIDGYYQPVAAVEKAITKLTARLSQPDAQPVAIPAEPELSGRWHHGEGVLCSGSLRIARADFDTNPPKEYQSKVFDDICNTMNAALAAWKSNAAPAVTPAEDIERDAARIEDLQDLVSRALTRAWNLGQRYWQQADSEFVSDQEKSVLTHAKFDTLIQVTRAAIAKEQP